MTRLPDVIYRPWGGIFNKEQPYMRRYRVLVKGTWVTCKKAVEVKDSLHYELFDGKQGVAVKGNWRLYGDPVSTQVTKQVIDEEDILEGF